MHVQQRVTWHSGKPWWQDRLLPGAPPSAADGGVLGVGFLMLFVLVLGLVGIPYAVVRWRRRVWWKRNVADLMGRVVVVEESKVKMPESTKYGSCE